MCALLLCGVFTLHLILNAPIENINTYAEKNLYERSVNFIHNVRRNDYRNGFEYTYGFYFYFFIEISFSR